MDYDVEKMIRSIRHRYFGAVHDPPHSTPTGIAFVHDRGQPIWECSGFLPNHITMEQFTQVVGNTLHYEMSDPEITT